MAIKYTQREITLHVTGDERFIFTSVRTWNFSTSKTTVCFTRGNKTLSFTGGQKKWNIQKSKTAACFTRGDKTFDFTGGQKWNIQKSNTGVCFARGDKTFGFTGR